MKAIATTGTTLVAALLLPIASHGQQRRSDPGWPCSGNVDPVYVRLAEATGGVTMLLKPAELMGSVAESRASDGHEEVVFRAGGLFENGVYDFDVPIDSTIRSAYFFLSMQCLQSVSVVRPSGDELRASDAGVEAHYFDAIRMFTIPQPDPGTWKVRISGRGYLSVVVKAATDLRLTGVAFGDRRAPVTRGVQPLSADVSGLAGDIAFRFVSAGGATIQPLTLRLEEEHHDYRRYSAEASLPDTDFRLAMTGTDQRGFRFQRVQEILVTAER